ncbi:LysR family transcriptional regulator [Alsobacter sp. SYSU M60028]|uniref:LysR family transcriptional regulator n=1 Tax=Alsobacter ponti TaxID=2962936 RepID=A0ABT1LC91_9HYPH|nr:LysR family transcriptional regulator [Alsobacter ponti]MCP8938556.1 LysR family transcriptional regulator [Alsobacter ponti]
MEFAQLRTFVTLAGTRHFGMAAERLRIAQPHVSRRIKQLEEDLKVTLFHRDRKNVRLTLAGEAFLPEAVKLLKFAEVARRRAVVGAQGKAGKLSVGVIAAALLGPLPSILAEFHRRYPEISLNFVDNVAPSMAQLQGLAEGGTDVVFAHPPVRLTGEYDRITIVRDPLVAVLAASHPLARSNRLKLIELADEPWIMFPREPNDKAIYDRIISLCYRAGFSPRITHEASNTLTRLGLVSAGFGVHLVHQAWDTIPFPGVVYVPIEPSDNIEITCFWRKGDANPLLLHLIEIVREFSVD